jgi:hypothetical protein
MISEEANLNLSFKSRMPALLCVLVVFLCGLAAYPIAEIGMSDDFSYVKTAQELAQTGHVVYNGWATAMLGWQLFLGALFVKLFGTSFLSTRASTFLIALFITYLTHRVLVRTGVSSINAAVGTLALVLSPLFLPLSLSFMSDVDGLFCIVLCLYACLRALQAEKDRGTIAWLAFAALSNAVGGTVRQIAWLGVLVMFPCTVWLLRRRRGVVPTGLILYVVSVIFIFLSLSWFHHQPYSVPYPLVPADFDRTHIVHLFGQYFRAFFSLAMFLMPVLIAFLPKVSLKQRSSRIILLGGSLACILGGIYLHHRHSLMIALAPNEGTCVTEYGVVNSTGLKGEAPVLLTPDVRLVLTAAICLVILGFIAFLYSSQNRSVPPEPTGEILPWRSFLILVVPFTVAYLVLLIPGALSVRIDDRYLLTLVLLEILVGLRYYQDSVRSNVPIVSVAMLFVFSGYSVAATHDAFSMYRARQEAFVELRNAGVKADAIDSGLFDHNGMTQIEETGHLNDARIKVPADFRPVRSPDFPADCTPEFTWLTPVILPGYALSYDPAACGGLSNFASVTYNNWLGVHIVHIYIVKSRKDGPE